MLAMRADILLTTGIGAAEVGPKWTYVPQNLSFEVMNPSSGTSEAARRERLPLVSGSGR